LTPKFDVHVEPTVDNVTRVAVRGEIDTATSDVLFEALIGALSVDRSKHVKVDLADVTALDASGIGVLLAAQNRAHMAGKVLSVCAATGLPIRVLEVTGLLGRLHGKSDGQRGRSPRSRRQLRRS
jgi:anti-anti-sigma factor